MENKSDAPELGAAPVRGSVGPPLSGARGTVLERLQRDARPVTIAALAAELGVHPNTAREHLDALVERGLAIRERAPAEGRGRPAWRYTAAADRLEPDVRVRDYAALAGALAGHLARTAADPAAEGLAAGREWGRTLASGRPAEPARAGATPRHRVVGLLDELGFAPEADAAASTVALRRCPLLDAARQYPEVVCQVHLGIVRGALEHSGGDPEATALLPFAEPGACRLHLDTAAVARGATDV
ncbi:helix-turn-helix transcriptional regulator [Blastococcus saxobsidens]|uniref:Putative transcriptional regulator, IclR family n=1 Tax=Blastococcus saxobsidens (strain DD2) TaxID=1146883 RepID=H6RU60_BLASD|nr:helix-turn-helix domain-containing protein [Blastococcus saxobsidens]CCG05667.1 putative transcriptional regulator, IclR family [Blastococcus saxobsidens DD2]